MVGFAAIRFCSRCHVFFLVRDISFRKLFPVGGIASQMLRDIPYAVVTLLTYEHLKHVSQLLHQAIQV